MHGQLGLAALTEGPGGQGPLQQSEWGPSQNASIRRESLPRCRFWTRQVCGGAPESAPPSEQPPGHTGAVDRESHLARGLAVREPGRRENELLAAKFKNKLKTA